MGASNHVMNTVSIINRTPSILFVIPLWVLSILVFGEVFDNGEPKWEYLWDDNANYVDNNHHLSFSWDNIVWAFKDGVVVQVYEPIALVLKQILHSVIKFNAQRYRVVNLVLHLINVYLVFDVGRALLTSANDYKLQEDIMESNLAALKQRTEKVQNGKNDLLQGANEAVGSIGVKNRNKKKNQDTISLSVPQQQRLVMIEEAHAKFVTSLREQAMGIVGCVLGALVFAVHPLQAHTIGWASCMSYFFSCSFSLLSFREFVAYQTTERERSWRKKENQDDAREGVNEHEKMWSINHHKLKAMLFYICATFCKAPAITLPAVFVVVDVFIYRTQLLAQKPARRMEDFWSPLPHRILGKLYDIFPVLWNLTASSLRAHAIFFVLIPPTMLLHMHGNGTDFTKVEDLALFEKLKKALWAIAWYICKLFWPSNLVASILIHSFSIRDHWEVVASLLAVPYGTTVILSESLTSAPHRVLACFYGSFCALLLPSLGFIVHGRNFFVSDRYMYMPLAMVCPVFGAVAIGLFTASNSATTSRSEGAQQQKRIMRKNQNAKRKESFQFVFLSRFSLRNVASNLGVVSLTFIIGWLVLFSTVVTPSNLHQWRTSELLWSRNAALFPENESAHTNLVKVYSNPPLDLDKALFHAHRAVEISPNIPKYWYNLVKTFKLRDDQEEIKRFLAPRLKFVPDAHFYAPWLHLLLGRALYIMGEWEDSQKELRKAARLNAKGAKLELDQLVREHSNPNAEREARESWRRTKAEAAASAPKAKCRS